VFFLILSDFVIPSMISQFRLKVRRKYLTSNKVVKISGILTARVISSSSISWQWHQYVSAVQHAVGRVMGVVMGDETS
jgi:hypothetical protein